MIGHSDMVLDLHHLESLDTIASASLDSNICIWDLYTGQRQQVMRGHRLGVLGLTYMPSQRVLISAGFDHEALVWSPFGSQKLFELKGHANSIVGVQRIGGPESNEILTADCDGMFKVWDVRKFQCVQTFEGDFKGMTVRV